MRQLEQYKLSYLKIGKELKSVLHVNAKDFDSRLFEKTFKKNMSSIVNIVPFEKTRNSAIIVRNINNLKYSKRINKNKSLPNLNIIGSIYQKSNEDGASKSLKNMNDTEYYVGFSFSYPIGNHKAKGDVRNTTLAVKELKKEYSITKNTFNVKQNSYLLAISSHKKQYKLLKQHLKSLKSQLRTERVKYKQARLNLQYILNTENNIASVEIDMLNLKNNFIQVYLDYRDLIQ